MYKKIIIGLTLLLSGRAMTLPFISRAGGTGPLDPPIAWLMPLIGDAIIGICALFIAALVMKRTGLWVWTAVIVWNALAIWDAASAFIIHITNPWPTFFMLELVGPSMFFAASAMHVAIIVIACIPSVRDSLMGVSVQELV